MANTVKRVPASLVAKAIPKKVVKKTTTKKVLSNTMYQAPPKGTVAYAEYELMLARNGGAKKEALKRTKPIKVLVGPKYEFMQDGAVGSSRANQYKYVDPGIGTAKEVKAKILRQKQRQLDAAKIAALGPAKKKKK